MTLLQWIARLTKGYIRFTGKKPDGLAHLKIKLEAAQRVRDQSKVVKGDFNPNEEWWKARPTKATPFSSPQTPQEKIDWLVKNVDPKAEQTIPPKATLEAMLKDGREDLIDHFFEMHTKELGKPKINIDTSGLKHPELVKKMMMDEKLKPTLVKTPKKKPPEDLASGGIARVGFGAGELVKPKNWKLVRDFIEKLFIKSSNDIRLGKGKWKGLTQEQWIKQHDDLTKMLKKWEWSGKKGLPEGASEYLGMNDLQIARAIKEATKKVKKTVPEVSGIDDALRSDFETMHSAFKGMDERTALKQKYPGITDDLLDKILVDKNPQRKAEVLATMDEYLKLRQVGKGEEEAYEIMVKSIKKPTKHASGGRTGFDNGGISGFLKKKFRRYTDEGRSEEITKWLEQKGLDLTAEEWQAKPLLEKLKIAGRLNLTMLPFVDDLEKGTDYAKGGIAGQLHLNRPGYQQGNRVNPFEETGNVPGGAYDTREYIKSPILKEDRGITTVKAPPKKATFEEIMSKHLGGIKAKRPKHFYFEKDEFGNVKLDESGQPIEKKFRMGPMPRFGMRDKSMENFTKVMDAIELAELNKEQSNYFWNKFGVEFGISGNELKALKEGKKYFKKENLPLISLDEDALLSFTKGLNLPGNTAATIFAESNLGGDVNASLEVANNIFNTKLTKDDVSWDIKPTFNVGKTEISPSVKGTDDVIEKIKLAVGNPNWSIEGELIKAQKRKETGGAPDQETQRLMQMIMADPSLWRWFGGPQGMMQMFGDTMTEDQKGDILKLSGSYTFDNDFKISPSLETDLLTNDTTYGLGINQGDFSAKLDYDDDLTGSVAYGPVQVGSTGDGARLDFNKDMGNFNLKANVDTEGNWFIGPQWKWTWGGKKEEPYYTEGKNLAELQEALQPKAKGGLAKILGV